MKVALVCHKYGIPLDDPCCYPLGFMMISAVLKQAGHDVTVYNENLGANDVDTVLSGLLDRQHCDAVLFTGFEEFLPYIKRDANICKQRGIKTILGGALASYKSVEMLDVADTVIVGEGEDVICQALDSTGIVQGSEPDLNTLPYPDYEGFGIDEYHRRHTTRYMGVLTSRGCPYSCKFCAQTCAYQARGLDGVFEEIDLYKERYGVQMIVFNDNTLNIRKDRFLEICEGMAKRDILWSAAIRCDNFDEEMAIAAKKSGCSYFVVGVESFSQARLDMMDKRIKVDDIHNCLDLLHRYNINYHGNVLMGLPGDTPEIMLDELERIPSWFKIFPCFVQNFVGTQMGGKDKLDKNQRKAFAMLFKQVIQRGGKYMYPELKAA